MGHLLPPFNLPQNIALLITDTLPSPSSFLLHKSLSNHLKSPSARPTSSNNLPTTTIISISEDLAKWKSIASKSNINLQQEIDSKRLTFIETSSFLSNLSALSAKIEELPPLRRLYDSIIASLPPDHQDEEVPSNHLVILDDITTLLWIGVPLLDITRFIRALVVSCRRSNATLIIRHHLTIRDDIDDLFRHLLQVSTYHLEVRSLSSGRSGAVSGEIALHACPSTDANQVHLLPRSSALQYRLTDTGAVFFERGTGVAVL
ncbi:hypothetical protein Agabi119p4_1025 [Agaricus bisporus var. burnettii]|uniref:Elongator complex protein 5 n=1 Tax=Agaricus bisporus var. burnettii TaxID=192524 RepID=A0A8H7FBN1_AGABI|nr:hypothetical protein Agabi119p4_1025 [Agaricus bisporus var. burnettii]